MLVVALGGLCELITIETGLAQGCKPLISDFFGKGTMRYGKGLDVEFETLYYVRVYHRNADALWRKVSKYGLACSRELCPGFSTGDLLPRIIACRVMAVCGLPTDWKRELPSELDQIVLSSGQLTCS